ncbi:MAG: Gfo/Idh/MocA family oxidoreductase [Armatimonadota bacterium]|nr:Gfo/Idh/MocA family oxidoreductase [Armatimonadota bacterium]
MINVGLIGIGGMGRMHFNCYRNNPHARVVAICDVDEPKRQGDWSSIGLNVDTSQSGFVDLSGIKVYENYTDLIADAEVRLVDVCLPTPLHAPVSIAALRAGKDVLCEKPMAMNVEECTAMQEAAQESGRQLMIGHCLRYWPQYVKAQEIIAGGEYGQVLYARFHRSGSTPLWSWNNWLTTGSQSGGAVLDMHIHDADTALWWFGRPEQVVADGIIVDDLPMTVDATWRYESGPLVFLHGGWDNNNVPFRYTFKVVMERGTVAYNSLTDGSALQLFQDQGSCEIPVGNELAYQNEIDDFIACLVEGRRVERVTPESSRLAVATVQEELRQIYEKNP